MYLKLLGASAVFAIIGLAYLHYKNMQDTIVAQAEEISTQQIVIKEKGIEVASLNNSIVSITANQSLLAEENQRWRKRAQRTRDIFENHDFGNLFMKKPGLIINRINKGTGKVFEEMESLINDPIVIENASDIKS